LIIIFFFWFSSISLAETTQRFVAPPTSTTAENVPTISDEAMEQCVRIYNEAKWIRDKINKTVVDNYSQNSVDAYNKMVYEHREKQVLFNSQCAGKRSYSACKAAQKLNKEQGLPHHECTVDN
jgi:formyltetrahydrofolate synthetase